MVAVNTVTEQHMTRQACELRRHRFLISNFILTIYGDALHKTKPNMSLCRPSFETHSKRRQDSHLHAISISISHKKEAEMSQTTQSIYKALGYQFVNLKKQDDESIFFRRIMIVTTYKPRAYLVRFLEINQVYD